MALKKKGLGRGLDALLSDNRIEDSSGEGASGVTMLRTADIEIIFMTPNMMNTNVSPHLTDEGFRALAERISRMQNEGVFDAHIDGARALCKRMNVPVWDCYRIW